MNAQATSPGLWGLLKETFNQWSADRAPTLGAALAFYTALSIAPLLVLTLSVAAFFFGEKAASGEISEQMQTMVGDQGAKAIEQMISASADQPTSGIVATVLSLATLLFGASGVFGQLQTSLNVIWGVKPRPGRGVMGMVRDRITSFAMVLIIAFLLLVSLVISTVLASLSSMLDRLPESLHWLAEGWLPQGINLGVSFLVITLLFAMMFKLLPDVKIAWRDVWLGAAISSLLFAIGKVAIGFYLGYSSMASSYGVAGSFVVFLVWVYYSAQILFFGAEFTQVYANRYGEHIVPAENAEPIGGQSFARREQPPQAAGSH